MSAETPAKDQDKFVLRLPDGMRDRLKAEAEANKRSMNAEIVARLEFSLEYEKERAKQAEKEEEFIMRRYYEDTARRLESLERSLTETREQMEDIASTMQKKGFSPSKDT